RRKASGGRSSTWRPTTSTPPWPKSPGQAARPARSSRSRRSAGSRAARTPRATRSRSSRRTSPFPATSAAKARAAPDRTRRARAPRARASLAVTDNRPVQVEAQVAATTDLSEAEKQARFEELQGKLVPLWRSIEKMSQDEQTIVVVPSMTGGKIGLQGAMLQAYEERFLFLLFLLRQPRARMIYVTSQAILPSIVDYYLALLPGVIPS